MATKNDILKKAMIAALEKSMGIVSAAAKKAKISRSVHYDWLKADENYKMQVDSIIDIALDFAETKLMQSINNGSDTATIFYLKTKGKMRGYIERNEVQNEISGNNVFQIVMKKDIECEPINHDAKGN